ncbi:MAG: putative phosphatidylinositol alpha-mannosyltransferase [Acidimicrobiia bacterium]
MADIALIQRFLPSASPGGVGYFTDGLARALVMRGHRVTIFSQDPAPADAPYGVRAVSVQGRLAPLRFPWALRRCDFSGFDVIHAQGDEQWVARRHAPPVVRTMHGTALAEAWFNGVRAASPKRLLLHLWFFVNEWIAARRADALVAVSAGTLRWYGRPGRVIPNGIDTKAFAPDGTPKSPHPTVLFVGDVDSRKRGRLLVTVMREVRRRVPDAELWLAGAGAAVTEPGCRSFGRVDDHQLQSLLRQAWVMCLPSAYEGFGRPYVEAMAAGTAVVASPNPGAREVLRDGTFGRVCEDAALPDVLCELLTDAEGRARLAQAGLQEATRYDWDTVAAAYEVVYDEVRRS